MWPSQGIFVFAVMAIIPPLIAIARRNFLAFCASAPVSLVAWLLVGYAYFVPIAIILLIVSFVVAVHRFRPEEKRAAILARTALLLPLVLIAAHLVKSAIIYNWSPPQIFAQALASVSTFYDRERVMTEALNVQFPKGTSEATLKSILLKQGFENVPHPQPSCRLPQSNRTSLYYGLCPKETREMRYDYRHFFSFPCGTTHLSVNWSVDPEGKITRMEARDTTVCL